MQLMNLVSGVLCLVLLLPASAARAADLVPVESFAATETYSNPAISSGGTYVAVSADLGENNHGIVVFRLADMATTAFIKLRKYELAVQIQWVSDTRLVYVKGGQWGAAEQPYNFGEIIGMDFDSRNHLYLFGYQESTLGIGVPAGYGVLVGVPPEPNGKFYMSRASAENHLPASLLYEVDAMTGRSRLLADVGERNLRFVLDANGVARFARGVDRSEAQLLYGADAEGKNWRKLEVGKANEAFIPVGFTGDGKQVLGSLSVNGGPWALAEADPALAKHEVLASDGFGDADWLVFGTKGRPLAVEFGGGRPGVALFEPQSPDGKLYRELSAGFPGQHVRFLGQSTDGNVVLVYIYSDRNPGEWAVMDRKSDKLSRLLQTNAAINPKDMGERRYIRFKTGDGLELDGYLTLPNGVTDPKRLPMVLLPHGGPHGVADAWRFDSDAQFLASRGYLVLQVNYRGSGGRGPDFRAAGYRQWSKRIQDDLADGMRWAVAQGYADAKRICVYGGSFGGYSAMMLAAKEPELVKCAAGYAGLYDLRAFANKSDTSRSFDGRAYVERVVGTDDDDLLANSPLAWVHRIKAPVFLAHGEEDERTPLAQAEAMKKALEQAGNKPIWMSVPGEAHGFYAQKNIVAFYKQLETFIAAHIGPGGR
jgi:dipeptidyl aminopeptidase/acylaminoacyl peptidase